MLVEASFLVPSSKRSSTCKSDVPLDSDNGYHGYWAQDIYSINSHLGTADDLKSLVSTAHSKGMYVMVDVVANHMGLDAISDDAPSPLNL